MSMNEWETVYKPLEQKFNELSKKYNAATTTRVVQFKWLFEITKNHHMDFGVANVSWDLFNMPTVNMIESEWTDEMKMLMLEQIIGSAKGKKDIGKVFYTKDETEAEVARISEQLAQLNERLNDVKTERLLLKQELSNLPWLLRLWIKLKSKLISNVKPENSRGAESVDAGGGGESPHYESDELRDRVG